MFNVWYIKFWTHMISPDEGGSNSFLSSPYPRWNILSTNKVSSHWLSFIKCSYYLTSSEKYFVGRETSFEYLFHNLNRLESLNFLSISVLISEIEIVSYLLALLWTLYKIMYVKAPGTQ